MSLTQGNLRELPASVIRHIADKLGGTAVLLTSKENFVARTQSTSLRSLIVEKVAELQEKYGVILTPKFNIIEPARAEYVKWYLEQRATDVTKNPEKNYASWAIVHLQDACKFRKELVGELGLKAEAAEVAPAPKEAVPA